MGWSLRGRAGGRAPGPRRSAEHVRRSTERGERERAPSELEATEGCCGSLSYLGLAVLICNDRASMRARLLAGSVCKPRRQERVPHIPIYMCVAKM